MYRKHQQDLRVKMQSAVGVGALLVVAILPLSARPAEGASGLNACGDRNVIVAEADQVKVIGTDGDDCLVGNDLDNLMFGRGGNDVLLGMAGDDLLVGDSGDDRLFGGAGDDTLFGYTGLDLLNGGNGDDVLNMVILDEETDRFVASNGDDLIIGNVRDLDGKFARFGDLTNGDDCYKIPEAFVDEVCDSAL